MKKYLVLIAVIVSFCCVLVASAQDCVVVEYGGAVGITFDPSPDPRAIGHVVFMVHEETGKEYSSGPMPLPQVTYQYEEGELWPDNHYTFRAIAYSDTLESSPSDPLNVCMGSVQQFVPPDELRPVKWLELVPPGVLKQIFGQ